MARFRVKPVEVEAVQWTGRNFEEIKSFVGNSLSYYVNNNDSIMDTSNRPRVEMHIITFGGGIRVDELDWVVKNVNGEFYVRKASVFVDTYEEIKEEEEESEKK